jgi:hypothetical protein
MSFPCGMSALPNFSDHLGLGTVRGALIEGPDGNFYGTTPNGGPRTSGTVFGSRRREC